MIHVSKPVVAKNKNLRYDGEIMFSYIQIHLHGDVKQGVIKMLFTLKM